MSGVSRGRASGGSTPTALVLAKAPVPGEVKTRLGADVGPAEAAELAAAALLDTLDVCASALGPGVVALAGDLSGATRGEEIASALEQWRVVPQHGDTFAARLAAAHGMMDGPVVQVGMDTPHVSAATIRSAAEALADHEAVLGLAEDGGWWVLALREPRHAAVLATVPTSREDTGALTLEALRTVCEVGLTATAYDVDTVREAERAACEAPGTRFAAAWRALASREVSA